MPKLAEGHPELATYRDHIGIFAHFSPHFLKQVRIKAPTETLVRGHHEDKLLLAAGLLQEDMILLADVLLKIDQHLVEPVGIITPGNSLVLGLFHLRGRHQLHRLGDLRGILDRLDTSADVAKVSHSSVTRGLVRSIL